MVESRTKNCLSNKKIQGKNSVLQIVSKEVGLKGKNMFTTKRKKGRKEGKKEKTKRRKIELKINEAIGSNK